MLSHLSNYQSGILELTKKDTLRWNKHIKKKNYMIVKAKMERGLYITLYNTYNVDSAELSIFVLFFSLKCLLDNHIFISSTENIIFLSS